MSPSAPAGGAAGKRRTIDEEEERRARGDRGCRTGRRAATGGPRRARGPRRADGRRSPAILERQRARLVGQARAAPQGPTFSEAEYGFRAFGELLDRLVERNVVELSEGSARATPRSPSRPMGRDRRLRAARVGHRRHAGQGPGGQPVRPQEPGEEGPTPASARRRSGTAASCSSRAAATTGRDPGGMPRRATCWGPHQLSDAACRREILSLNRCRRSMHACAHERRAHACECSVRFDPQGGAGHAKSMVDRVAGPVRVAAVAHACSIRRSM